VQILYTLSNFKDDITAFNKEKYEDLDLLKKVLHELYMRPIIIQEIKCVTFIIDKNPFFLFLSSSFNNLSSIHQLFY
jgi:hypothetical protein